MEISKNSLMSKVISSNKILAHLDRVNGNQVPITADIFLNNYCNNSCSYCTYKRWEFDNDARYMHLEDFMMYARRLRRLGVLGIILTGGGEPTIAKDFDQITQWLESNQFHYGINTNFNRFVDCHPDYLKVSLDAWDEESYMAKRGVEGYETVRDNIIHYAADKPKTTSLGIQLLAKKVTDVYNFYYANKDLPVDYMVVRPVESTNGSYYEPSAKEIDELKTTDSVGNVIKAIDEIQSNDKRVIKNFKWNLLGTKFENCIGQWAQIAVNELGEVMYCCHKPYQIVGHIMDEDILEKKAKAVTDMKMCDVPCRLTSVNQTLEQIYGEHPNKEFI